MKYPALRAGIMTLCVLIAACGNPNQRLDEYVFHDGPGLKLKVVRYYRNIPFNYLGEYAVVMCQSENTMNFAAHDQQDAGWRTLGAGGGQGSKSAEEAALRVKDDYKVVDGHTLVAKTNVFNISFDACGHFINWDPSRLPQTMIDPVDKPDSCAPNGPADCRYYDFEGDRAPQYEQISVTGEGQVSFTARSKAFKDIEWLRIETVNNGAVWHVETVGLGKVNRRQAREGTLGYKVNRRQARQGELRSKRGPPGGEGTLGCADKRKLDPDAVRSLSMPLLEKGMNAVSLMDWLESVLPPRSMVIWPDALTACDEPRRTDRENRLPLCAEIRFNNSDGDSGALSIVMAADAENTAIRPSFHSAVYTYDQKSVPIRSLTGLRERLTASAS